MRLKCLSLDAYRSDWRQKPTTIRGPPLCPLGWSAEGKTNWKQFGQTLRAQADSRAVFWICVHNKWKGKIADKTKLGVKQRALCFCSLLKQGALLLPRCTWSIDWVKGRNSKISHYDDSITRIKTCKQWKKNNKNEKWYRYKACLYRCLKKNLIYQYKLPVKVKLTQPIHLMYADW